MRYTISIIIILIIFISCRVEKQDGTPQIRLIKERQVTFSLKNHALDNNDNFSPDGKYLCYDTRGTVEKNSIAHCRSIEKVEVATGKETVLYEPPAISKEDGQAAPGVGAVSWHPSQDRVIFIHGPFPDEIAERGYYSQRNRSGIEVSADGSAGISKVDLRDIAANRPTIAGAQRGGTHRHEYSRDGRRIGFTYDDFLLPQFGRSIGYLEKNEQAPSGYSHYFVILLKPAEEGKSKAGEIEKVWGDSWIDSTGSKRAFIGKVRTQNGIDYEQALFVAEIPDHTDITTAASGTATEYPTPPQGIIIRRVAHTGRADGIVRASYDGKNIAYFADDEQGIKQVYIVAANGSDLAKDEAYRPKRLSNFRQNAYSMRWHPQGEWIFCISKGNIAAIYAKTGKNFGRTIWLTNDNMRRDHLVVSHNGSQLACIIPTETTNQDGIIKKDVEGKDFLQIFVIDLEMNKL